MKISPSVKEIDGVNRSSLFINQDGKAMKHAYSRENPNGMPDMEQVTVKGVLVWDDTKRLEFLDKMVHETIIPKLRAINGETPVVAPTSEEIKVEDVEF